MIKQHALFIYNPFSGDVPDKDDIIASICDHLGNYELWKTTGEKDGEKIKKLVKDGDYDLILVGGGDGTIKMVAEALEGKKIKLLPIPFGSANGLATCLGLKTWEDSLESLDKGSTIDMDLMDVNGQVSLHLSDFGLNAGMIKKFEDGDERGMVAYFKNSLSSLRDIKPYPFKIILRGKEENVEAKMLIVANGSKYGTGATINPGSKMDDGIFEIIALNPNGLQEWLELTYGVMREDLSGLDFVRRWSADRVSIENSAEAPFHVDGEIVEVKNKVSFQLRDHKIKMYWHPENHGL
ncbi:diacylglycerol/lipid kinase family protein [Cyclobacterium plantarum]|uniref:diacylglycerol/lipid kinase family protein n=1 Tax=Cyclobacterium plantarum TaxID=2716263 RepID=UPI003F7021C4